MIAIALVGKKLFFNNNGVLLSCFLGEFQEYIDEKFASLPSFNNDDEVKNWFLNQNLAPIEP